MSKNRKKATKRAVRAAVVDNRQTRVAEQLIGEDKDTPLFCFKNARHSAEGLASFRPSPTEAQALLRCVSEWGRQSWDELLQHKAGRRGTRRHKIIPIDDLAADAKHDIRKSNLDKIIDDYVFEFRLQGQERLWGFKIGRVFHVLWWDPDHLICPAELRNT